MGDSIGKKYKYSDELYKWISGKKVENSKNRWNINLPEKVVNSIPYR